MSATDELRRLLDGRGVEWGAFGDEYADQTLVHTERFGRFETAPLLRVG